MPYLALVLLLLNRAVLAVLAFSAAVLTSPSAFRESHPLSLIENNKHFLANHIATPALLLLLVLAIEIIVVPIRESVRTATIIIGLSLVPVVLTLYPLPLHAGFYKQQLQQPWLPAEVITLDPHQQVVGYVLSRDNGWFVVLIASNRTIYYIQAGQVVSQQVCQMASTGSPLVPLFNVRATVAACPGSSSALPGSGSGQQNDEMHPPLRLDG